MTDPIKVLLIDQNPVRGPAMADTLRAAGCVVELEAMPAASLGLLANPVHLAVQVLIIQAALTGMGAARLIRAIRTLPAYGRIPVVLLGAEPLPDGDPPGSMRVTKDQDVMGAVRRALVPGAVGGIGKVLVVDDNQVNRTILMRIISANGYEVEIAEDGIEALTKATRECFALIFMDCEMPRMDGFEATRAIRRIDAQRRTHTPIVACTARSLNGDREMGMAAGMDDYLVKPVPIEAVEAQLSRWLVASPPRRAESSSQVRAAVRSPSPVDGQRAGAAIPSPDPSDEPWLDRAVLDRIRGYGGTVLQVTTQQFLGEMEQRIDELVTLFATKDFENLMKRAHGLKGSSGSLGARRLWRTLAAIEAESRQHDEPALSGRMAVIKQVAEATSAEMNAYLASIV